MKLLKYQPHQKITYSAGLISLVLLPVLCLYWLYKFEISKIKHGVDIVFWSLDAKKTVPEDYWLESVIKKKNTIINLTGNDRTDNISLQYAQVLLSKWKVDKDDSQVLNFHFGNNAKYWTFVEAINVCKAVKLNSYIPYQNNMYAFWNFHPKPVPEFSLPPCATFISFSDDIVQTKESIDLIILSQKFIKDYWAPGIVFLLMSILTLNKLYRHPNLLTTVSQ
jgi:hypothetical protein